MALLLAASCNGDSQPSADAPISLGLDRAVTPIEAELEQQMKQNGGLGQLCFTSRDILYAIVDLGLIRGKYSDESVWPEAFALTHARLVSSLEAAEQELPLVADLDPAVAPYYERLVADVARARTEMTTLPSVPETPVEEAIEATARALLSIFAFGDYPAKEAYEAAIQLDDEACPSPQ